MPGISCPLRESWFCFSSFFSTFGILERTKAWLFNSLATLSTSVCVALSFDSRAWALASSVFAASIAEAVFSDTPALPRAASIRAIAASNLLVSAFIAGASSAFGVSAGADGCSVVDVAVSFETRGVIEPDWFPLSGFTCSFVVEGVEGVTSAWIVAAPPNIM